MHAADIGVVLLAVVLACNDVTRPADRRAVARRSSISPVGTVIVAPGAMHGWTFYDDQHDTTCTDASVCRLVNGPASAPAGAGSAELATPTAGDGKAVVLADFVGTRFDQLTTLRYSTYRQTADAGNNLAIALQFNVDYDLADAATGYQGRIVFEPYQGTGGNVPQSTWQEWDAKAGKWWGSKSTVTRGGVAVANPCVQASPCSWSQLLADFPDIGIHATLGAVVLKAGSNWPGFRGNVDKLIIGVDGATTTFDFELTPPVSVPIVPPDTVPLALFDSLGGVQDPGGGGVPWVRGIVVVDFTPGTVQGDRQTIVDGVGGSVVGGMPWRANGDGEYYVRVAATTFDSLVSTVRFLQSSPQVESSHPYQLDSVPDAAYRAPVEGLGWRDWRLVPESTSVARRNWPLEATSAPMAWGCSTADTVDVIAVVDQGLFRSAALGSNVAYSQIRTDSLPNGFYNDHGTHVAEMLAAAADGQLSVGMLWKAKLALYDIYIDPTRSTTSTVVSGGGPGVAALIRRNVVRAGLSGDRIINLSFAIDWEKIHVPSDASVGDTVYRESRHTALKQAINEVHRAGKFPLFVIAAGNDHIPAYWGGYDEVKNDFPNDVIVVGGSTATGELWTQSNFGSPIDVWAPADSVWVYGRGTAAHAVQGTSFAAPLVAGVAGQLLGFDPSLTNSQIVSLINQGARTPASSNGSRLLDAYGALKAAAARLGVGSALCGNRVWLSNGQLIVERGSGTETLFSYDTTQSLPYPDVFHGGKRIAVGTTEMHDWNPLTRSWSSGAYNPAPTDLHSASFFSIFGFAHDLQMSVSATSGTTVTLRVNNNVTHTTVTKTQPFSVVNAQSRICVRQHMVEFSLTNLAYSCQFDSDSVSVGTVERIYAPQPAMAPQANYMLVAANLFTKTTSWTTNNWQPCAGTDTATLIDSVGNVLRRAPFHICTNPGISTENIVRGDLFRVDSATNTWTQFTSLPNEQVLWIGLNERQDEFVLGQSGSVETDTLNVGVDSLRPSNSHIAATGSHLCPGNHVEYRLRASPSIVSRDLPIIKPNQCPNDYTAIGAMSPSRIPSLGTQLAPFGVGPSRAPAGRRLGPRRPERTRPTR